jgi:hypothetical protein
MNVRCGLFFVGVVALTGCPPNPTPQDAGNDGVTTDTPATCDAVTCTSGTATFTVGTGTDSMIRTFRPLADGEDVFLVPGFQGNQHIWIGFRARGIDPTLPRIELNAYRMSDNRLIGRLRFRLPFRVTEENGVWALGGQTLIIEDDQYCSVLPGDVRITVDFDDAAGHRFFVERHVHIAGMDPMALAIDRESRIRCCTERFYRCFPDAGTRTDAATDLGLRA